MLMYKQKKNQSVIGILVSINVIGSAGPILMAAMALKSYTRLPVLGSAINKFLLYCPIAGSDALSPEETIVGRLWHEELYVGKEARNFTCTGNDEASSVPEAERKAWLNKSLNLKISSH